jgi:hypothetical protein
MLFEIVLVDEARLRLLEYNSRCPATLEPAEESFHPATTVFNRGSNLVKTRLPQYFCQGPPGSHTGVWGKATRSPSAKPGESRASYVNSTCSLVVLRGSTSSARLICLRCTGLWENLPYKAHYSAVPGVSGVFFSVCMTVQVYARTIDPVSLVSDIFVIAYAELSIPL